MRSQRERIAWAAGLFEGEGCFHAYRPSKRPDHVHLEAALTTTDWDVLDRFHAIVGVGNIHEVKKRQPHHKQSWKWTANGYDAVYVYDLIEDWLGERRRERFGELLAERRAYEATIEPRRSRFPRYTREESPA